MLIRLYCLLHQALCPPGIDALRTFRGTRNRYAVAQRQQTGRVVGVDARVGIGGAEGVAQHLLYLLPLLDVQRPEAWVGRGPGRKRGPYGPAGQVLIKHAGEQLEERLELFPRLLDGTGALDGELAELVTGGRHSRHQQFLLGSVMVLDSTTDTSASAATLRTVVVSGPYVATSFTTASRMRSTDPRCDME